MGNEIGNSNQNIPFKLNPNNIGGFWMNFCSTIRDPFMAMSLWQVGPMPWMLGNNSLWSLYQNNNGGQNWGVGDSFTSSTTTSTSKTQETPKTQEEKDVAQAKKKQLEIKFNKLKNILNEYKESLDETKDDEGVLIVKINRLTSSSINQENYDALLALFNENKDAILEFENKKVQKEVTTVKNQEYEKTVKKLNNAIEKDGKFDLDNVDIMELISTWNNPSTGNRSFIMVKLYNKTCGKTPEQHKAWKDLAKQFHEKLIKSADDIRQDDLSTERKDSLNDALEAFNKFSVGSGLTKANINKYQKAFDSLYEQIRLAEAEIADKKLKEKYEFLGDENPYKNDKFAEETKKDLKEEKI